MTTTQVYVHGIRAEGQLQYQARSGTSTRWSPLHMPQSPLDKACGIHALLIAIAIVTRTPRASLEKLADSSRGQWHAFWSYARSLYFEGASARELIRCAEALDGIEMRKVRILGEDKLYEACRSAIEAGGVPLLDLDGPNLAHWSVALGVESRAGKPSALLCLDPSVGAPWAAFTNARLDLSRSHKATRGKRLYAYRDSDGRLKQTRVSNVLAVMPIKKPP